MDWLAKLNGQFDRASTAVKGGAGDPPGSAAAAVANVANTLAAAKPRVDPRETRLRPVVAKATWGGPTSSFAISMQGPRAGLIRGWFDRFPGHFSFWLHGKVVVGDLVSNAPRLATLKVTARYGRYANPALNGEVSATLPVEADGSFALPVQLLLDDAVPRPWRLTGVIRIEGTEVPTESADVTLEHASLSRMVELLEGWEPAQAVTRLRFIAMVRKVLLPASAFDKVIGTNPKDPALFKARSPEAERLIAGSRVMHGPELITLSHVLVGIEGGERQKPQPQVGRLQLDSKALRVDLAVTWGGDLGKPLTLYLVHKYFSTSFDIRPDAQESYCAAMLASEQRKSECLECFRRLSAPREDLVGDVDGVNLAARYDPGWSLADNLRAYYYADADDHYGERSDSRRRYSEFLVHTLNMEDKPALALAAGGGPPRLSAASHAFIAEEIARAANNGLVARAMENRNGLDALFKAPPAAMELLKPQSWAVQQLASSFVAFVEDGLAKEPAAQE